ncbi:MAG: hypothetical protein DRJ60_01085 [Thermoprotei archaeon]|nr:MAG: hypothetical protein DRJ60_01085 [Thermoprotei archaeon]
MRSLKYTIDIIGIMILIWCLMLAMLLLIDRVVVNIRIPIEGIIGSIVNNGIQLIIAGIMFLAWLLLWYRLTVYCRKRRLRLWSKSSQLSS